LSIRKKLTEKQKEAFRSSKTDLWATPQDFFDKLNAIHHFTLDVCATAENAKCKNYFSPEQNGLVQLWSGVAFMNPPYGSEIVEWIAKAFHESARGVKVVCLLPARTDTRWFHKFCLRGEIEFIQGRLKFGGFNEPALFPSMVVIFHPRVPEPSELGLFDERGIEMDLLALSPELQAMYSQQAEGFMPSEMLLKARADYEKLKPVIDQMLLEGVPQVAELVKTIEVVKFDFIVEQAVVSLCQIAQSRGY
jgi:phage N-6-adenine-methyltransferase